MNVNLSSQELKLITRQETRALIVLLVVCLLTFNTTDNVQAAPGDLDLSFDTDGIVTTAISTDSNDEARAVVIRPDGKIVVAGRSQSSGQFDIALVRYEADGDLDPTFGTGGIVTTPIDVNNGDDEAYGVAIQGDGKIVVAGNSQSGGQFDIAVAWYNPDGSLDNDFSGNGIVTTAIATGTGRDEAYGVAQSNGKIVVAGRSEQGGTFDIALARYEATSGSSSGGNTSAPGGGGGGGCTLNPRGGFDFTLISLVGLVLVYLGWKSFRKHLMK